MNPTIAILSAAMLAVSVFHLTADAGDDPNRRAAFREAQEPLRDQRWDDAVAALQKFRNAHPGTEEAKEAWVLEIQALLSAGKGKAALEGTEAFLKAHADDVWKGRVQHLAVHAHRLAGSPKNASNLLRELADNSTSSKARHATAALHVALADLDFDGIDTTDDLGRTKKVKNLQRALQSYRQALTIGVDDAEGLRIRERIGTILKETGLHNDAVVLWTTQLEQLDIKKPLEREALTELPTDPKTRAHLLAAYTGLGHAYLNTNQSVSARQALRVALRLAEATGGDAPFPVLVLLAKERFTAARAVKDGSSAFEEGVDYLRKALRAHGEHKEAADAHRFLAEAYEQWSKPAQAAAEWRAFAERYPKHDYAGDARVRAGDALLNAGRHDDAISAWNDFLRNNPSHDRWSEVRGKIVTASFQKGESLKAQDDIDGAIAAWRTFAAEQQDDARAPIALSYAAQALLIDSGKLDEARGLLREVAGRYAKTPSGPAAALLLAKLWQDHDPVDLEKAMEGYERVKKDFAGTPQAAEAGGRLSELKEKHLEVHAERVLGTKDPATVRVTTRNIKSLKVRVYRLGLEAYFQKKGTLKGVEGLQLEIVKPDFESTWELGDYKDFHKIEADRPLPIEGPGAFVVVAGDDDLTSTTLVLISDIACVVKQSPGRQLFVWAFDRTTKKPVAGARVLATDRKEVGVTGKDGIWQGNKGTHAGNVLVLSDAGAASTEIEPGKQVQAGFHSKAYVYADRPVYRPGQQVRWRGLFMKANGGNYLPVGKHKGSVQILDARGDVALSARVKSTAFGTFQGTYALGTESPLGTYRVRLDVDHAGTWEGTFQVQEYRKPEFVIAVEPEQAVVRTGDDVKAKIALTYSFGGPVADAPVAYEVWRMPRTFTPSVAEDYSWYFKDERRKKEARIKTAGRERVARGRVTTDEAGEAEIVFPTQERDEDAEYVVRAMAQDITRRWVMDEGRIPVTQRDYMALVKTDRKVIRPKQDFNATVRTVDALERAVARSGELVLLRLRQVRTPLNPKQRGKRVPTVVRDEEIEEARHPLAVGESGEAEMKLSLEKPGRWRLRWRGKDARDRLVTAYVDIEVSGEEEDPAKDARLVAAKTLYREGEAAGLMIRSPMTEGVALLTYEGEKVLDYMLVPLTGTSTMVEAPLKGHHAPNVFFKVAIPVATPGDEKLLEADTEVVVLRHLDIDVSIAPKTAKPGDEVEIAVVTRDAQGKPVTAEVGLSLIDEAVFAIAPDTSPSIRPYFYDRRRTLGVMTASSMGTRFYGTTRETSKDLLAEAAARSDDGNAAIAMALLADAREALREGNTVLAVKNAVDAIEKNPQSWDARVLMRELARNQAAQAALQQYAADKAPAPPMTAAMPAAKSAPPGAIGIAGGSGGARFETRRSAARPAASMAEEVESDNNLDFEDSFGESEGLDDAPFDGADSKGMRRGREGRKSKKRGRSRREVLKSQSANLVGRQAELLERHQRALVLSGTQGNFDRRWKSILLDLQDEPGMESMEVRRHFEDSAYWNPALETGDDGKATVRVKLPDNLTSWRADVRGVSAKALVGSGKASCRARRDLLVRMDTPRFLTQGDEITVPTAVHNNSGAEVDAKVEIKAEGVTLSGNDETLKIGARGRGVSDRDVSATEPGRVKLTAKVSAGGASDAVEVSLSTKARGIPLTIDGRSGFLDSSKSDSAETFLDVPENLVPGTLRLQVLLAPQLHDAIRDALLVLETFPYGCLEQNVHRFLPLIEAQRALSASGSPAADVRKSVLAAAERGARQIRNFQHKDGSFGWFAGGNGNVAMTAYALRGLVGARKAGVKGLDRAIDKATQALRKMVVGGPEDDRALGHLALAEVRRRNAEAFAASFRNRNEALSTTGLAWLCLAAHEEGRGFEADELARLLIERVQQKDDVSWWTARKDDCFTGSDFEATAWAVTALVRTKKASLHVERAMNWMRLGRMQRRGLHTKDMSAFVHAACAWLEGGRAQRFGGTIDVLLDGNVVKSIETGDRILDPSDRRFRIGEANSLSAGRHRLGFKIKGQGELCYAVRLSAVQKSDDLPGDTHGFTLSRSYLRKEEAADPGSPPKQKPGYSVLRPAARPTIEAKDVTEVVDSDKLLVRLTIKTSRTLRYVLVEDPLPSAFEVLEDTTSGPFDWQERRDDRQVFFLSKVPEGTTTIDYVIQATHWGRSTALGTHAYAMYRPEFNARAAGTGLLVKKESNDPTTDVEAEATPDERWARAQKLVEEKRYKEARETLTSLKQLPLRDEIVEAAESHLLRCAIEMKDAKEIVRAREELVRRNTGLIPNELDDQRAIAFAYHELGEFDPARPLMEALVYRAFGHETQWAQTLTARGEELKGLTALNSRQRAYPLAGPVVQAMLARAQRMEALQRPEDSAFGSKGKPMDHESIEALRDLAAHASDEKLFGSRGVTAPINYLLVPAHRRVGELDTAANEAEAFLRRFPDSRFVDDAYYFLSDVRYREFELAPDDKAKAASVEAAAKPLVERRFKDNRGRDVWSPFRTRAYHYLARVRHIQGRVDEALALYKKAKGVEDAAEAVAFLTRTSLSMDSRHVHALNQPLTFALNHRGVESVSIQAYPVDLQVLFAIRKTLDGLHRIDLSGLVPAHAWEHKTGGKDHTTSTVTIPTKEKGPGVWLVIAKSGKLETSGLVSRTDLAVELQRIGDKKIRVYVTDAKGRGVRGAYVAASDGVAIRTRGRTDGRGILEATGALKKAFVVVSLDDRYATASDPKE